MKHELRIKHVVNYLIIRCEINSLRIDWLIISSLHGHWKVDYFFHFIFYLVFLVFFNVFNLFINFISIARKERFQGFWILFSSLLLVHSRMEIFSHIIPHTHLVDLIFVIIKLIDRSVVLMISFLSWLWSWHWRSIKILVFQVTWVLLSLLVWPSSLKT